MSGKYNYVYLIGRDAGPIKIGVSNNPHHRIVGLQVGCPFPIRVLNLELVQTKRAALNIEREPHINFSNQRLYGEWFEVAFAEAERALQSILERIHNQRGRRPWMAP